MRGEDPERRDTYVLIGASESDSDEEVRSAQSPATEVSESRGSTGSRSASRAGLQPVNVLQLPGHGALDRHGSRQNSGLRIGHTTSSLNPVKEHEESSSSRLSGSRAPSFKRVSSTSSRLSRPQTIYDPLASHELHPDGRLSTGSEYMEGHARRSEGVRKGHFRTSAFVSGGWTGAHGSSALNHHGHNPRPTNPSRSSGRGSVWRRTEVPNLQAHRRDSSASEFTSSEFGYSSQEDIRSSGERGTAAQRISYDATQLKLRNAQIAAAKAVSILTKMERQGYAGLEKNSVYGSAIAMPQIARSVGWSRTTVKHAIRSYVFLLVNFVLQGLLLTFIGESIQVINPNAGQMHLCDFGASLTSWASACPNAANCVGPDGTQMTLPRLYDFDVWNMRKFVQTSLLSVFPHRKDDILRLVDPGEFGVENYICRLCCCFLFTMSVVEDLRSTFTLGYLLMRLPSQDESWIVWEPPDWAPKAHAKAILGWNELDLVQFKVAGMSFRWKFFNMLVVFVPKILLWYGTVHAGFQFLMETSTIAAVVINALAMTFLLQIDEMIFSRLSTESVRHIMEKLKDYPLFDLQAEEAETEEDCLERFQTHEIQICLCQDIQTLLFLIPRRLLIILAVMCIFVWEYYNRNCVMTEEGYVSKPMYLPSVSNSNLLSFLFGKPPHQDTAFWSWSSVHHGNGEAEILE
mmetsp:Transcript_41529/g.75251  ORF Transcript_41529/g.75251 Transcript_41529/m.75251 type:complete len:688 (+) Transcript_41529:57-2120(+)